MEGYGPRIYREAMGGGRFASIIVSVGQTDLWIGIDAGSFGDLDAGELEGVTIREIESLQETIRAYEETHGGFIASLVPVPSDDGAPDVVRQLIEAGRTAGIGPMGAVAGTFSELIGRKLQDTFPIREIVVENGGDIYLDIEEDLQLRIFAGSSPLSDKLGVLIPAGESPLGVCTSAGTVGPSLSFGTADAVMIAHRSTAQADAYATAFGNEVHSTGDVDGVIGRIREIDAVVSAVIIKDDKAGICGSCEVKVYR